MAAQSGHRLTWNEDRYGSLEVGKVADMVVLAEDPLSCDLDRLKDVRVGVRWRARWNDQKAPTRGIERGPVTGASGVSFAKTRPRPRVARKGDCRRAGSREPSKGMAC
jgi:hypothetical protein